MTLFDAVGGTLLLLSALFGLMRGATREVTTLLAFALSLVLALVGARFVSPLIAQAVHIAWMATALATLGVFVIAYAVLRSLGGALSEGVRDTALSGLDRGLGLGIGLARGVLILGVFGLLIGAAVPAQRLPGWISQARLYPLAEGAGAALRTFAPRGLKMTHGLTQRLAQVSPPSPSVGEIRRPRPAVVVESPQ